MKTRAPEEPGDHAERAARDLDRKAFYLKAICNATHELSGLEDQAQIMETFLLTVMGSLGIDQAFIVVINRETMTGEVASRGLGAEDITRLQNNISIFFCISVFDTNF